MALRGLSLAGTARDRDGSVPPCPLALVLLCALSRLQALLSNGSHSPSIDALPTLLDQRDALGFSNLSASSNSSPRARLSLIAPVTFQKHH